MEQISSLAVSATAWLPAMTEATLRTSAVLLLSGAVAFGLRGSAATVRHLVWALALVGVLLAPVAGTYLPTIDIPVPPLSPAVRSAVTPGPRTPAPAFGDRSPGREVAPMATTVPVPSVAPSRTTTTAPTTAHPAPASGPRLTSSQMWSFAALGLWLVGAAALLLRTGLGLLATRRLGRAAEPPIDGEWRRLATELTVTLGVTRPIQVLSSPLAAMPMTWGWRRPIILVPGVGTWPTARKRVVLLHELSHVKRLDCAWQFVANLALSLHWFNPLVWLAVRAQRIERERACDDAVVQAGTSASSYADHLLEIARTHHEPRWSAIAAVAMARRSQLEGRLLSILAPGDRPRTTRRTVLALTGTMTVLIAFLAAVAPSVGAATAPVSPVAPVLPMPTAQSAGPAPQAAPEPQAPQPATPQPAPEPEEATAEPEALQRGRDQRSRAPQALDARREELARDLESDLAQATTELEAMQRRIDERSRALSAGAARGSQALEGRRDELARELEALEARASALSSLSGSPEARADLELRLREARERAAQFMNAQGEFGNEFAQLGEREMELVAEALEQVRDLQHLNLGRIVDGVAIAEDVRARVRNELERVQARLSIDQPKLDQRVVELLLESLSDDDPGVRQRAARGLGSNRVMEASGPLADAVRDTDAGVRATAAWALGQLRADTAVGPLTGALDDADPEVVERAAEALGRIRSEAAVPALSGALTADTPAVRARAAWALGRIRSADAVPALSDALDDDETAVRVAVVGALGRIRDTVSVGPLVGALDDQEPRIRREAARALGRLRNSSAVDGLVAALGDAEPGVVRHAVGALGQIRDPAAVAGLVGVLGHEDVAVVEEAAQALGRIRDDAAVDGLAAALGTAAPEAAQDIVRALGRIGGERAVEALIAATDDASPAVRKVIIEALSGPRWGRRAVAPVAPPRPDRNPPVAPGPN